MIDQSGAASSPFHKGEQLLQERYGKRDKAERYGQTAIRDYLPEQHRDFYQQLPFLVAGCVDDNGWPWASVISGPAGFVQSPSPTSLTIDRTAITALHDRQDPLAKALETAGCSIGLLGIELTTRRRNRANATIGSSTKHIDLNIEQSFGNCPKYIQSRSIQEAPIHRPQTTFFTVLDQRAIALIRHSDTFFVASSHPKASTNAPKPKAYGVDVSHRGGMPGFVQLQNDVLTIPDFKGNNFFNTLGNFALNPKAGLVFIDFETGELLLLTGKVDFVSAPTQNLESPNSNVCSWQFTVVKGLRIRHGFPYKAFFENYSPQNLRATQ